MVEYRYDGGDTDRQILIGMITNRSVLGRIATAWRKGGLFASRHCNIVAELCIEFLEGQKAPPGKNIEAAVREWADTHRNDKDTIAALSKLMADVSGDYERMAEEVNSDYLIETAQKRFDRIAKDKLAESIKQACDAGKHDKVDVLLAAHRPIEMGSAEGSYLSDEEAWRSAFESNHEPLIEWRGDLGKFMRDAWERDGFIAYVAPEKRGKSHHLIRAAYTAARQRKKVAFFGAGDMSVAQYRKRFAALTARRPLRPGTFRIPTGIEVYTDEQKGFSRGRPTGFKEKSCESWLSWKEGHDAYMHMLENDAKLRDDPLWISCHANSTLSVAKIKMILDQREQVDGFVPDVIVIDYADILALSGSRMEPRDQHDQNWRQLRALSLERHCLVVTATQSNRKGYEVDILRMDNMSEDKRKLAHATGVLGINVTAPEKEQGICRLNWIALRENEFSSRQVVYCAGCLGFSDPFIKTTMGRDIPPDGEEGTVSGGEPDRPAKRKTERSHADE